MTIGDDIKATWPDGLQAIGRYLKKERGFIVLATESGIIACDSHTVLFEKVNKDATKKETSEKAPRATK